LEEGSGACSGACSGASEEGSEGADAPRVSNK